MKKPRTRRGDLALVIDDLVAYMIRHNHSELPVGEAVGQIKRLGAIRMSGWAPSYSGVRLALKRHPHIRWLTRGTITLAEAAYRAHPKKQLTLRKPKPQHKCSDCRAPKHVCISIEGLEALRKEAKLAKTYEKKLLQVGNALAVLEDTMAKIFPLPGEGKQLDPKKGD